jgi:Ca2+-binding RTX toxin-like protein
MTTVVFNRAFNLDTIDFADFLGGNIDIGNSSATQIHVVDGRYDAFIFGENFNPFALTGTIHEVEARVNLHDLFTATDMNVDLGDAWDAREDDAALKDIFFGGNDTFKGSKGADVINGFGGVDRINGGRGADHVTGGAGGDVLSGGADADTFVYEAISDSATGGVDRLFDLDDAQDFIDLQALDVRGSIKAIYNAAHDTTSFRIDVDRDHHVDMVITARGDHSDFDLDHGHFLI